MNLLETCLNTWVSVLETTLPKTLPLTEIQFSGKTYFYTIASRKLGANITYGGGKHDFGDLYYQPTIMTGMTKEMRCYKCVVLQGGPSVRSYTTLS